MSTYVPALSKHLQGMHAALSHFCAQGEGRGWTPHESDGEECGADCAQARVRRTLLRQAGTANLCGKSNRVRCCEAIMNLFFTTSSLFITIIITSLNSNIPLCISPYCRSHCSLSLFVAALPHMIHPGSALPVIRPSAYLSDRQRSLVTLTSTRSSIEQSFPLRRAWDNQLVINITHLGEVQADSSYYDNNWATVPAPKDLGRYTVLDG